VGVTPSVPVKANSGVRARVPAAGKVLEEDDKPTLLREDQHYLHYITMCKLYSSSTSSSSSSNNTSSNSVLTSGVFYELSLGDINHRNV